MHQFDLNRNVLSIPHLIDNMQRIGLCEVPLNLLAFIVSYIEDVGDLARLCRTSRLLLYMAQPQLYKRITLTSHDTIRYRDDLPEGFGGASPFTMGLNALVTRKIAWLVQSLSLQGEWREHDLEEYSKVGRVPDGSMMLNIAVRAAVDRCTNLTSFSWKLNIRLMSTVYATLASLSNLESFHLRFPSTRTPQPQMTVPALPNLREFTMTDYDPLCHPDDLSTMFFHATKLESLKMHFSPRMRSIAEPSVQVHNFFRRNIAAHRTIKLKRMALYNCFSVASPELSHIFLPDKLEDATMINSFGPGSDFGSSSATHFIDQTWAHEHISEKDHSMLKSIRGDKVNHLVCKDLVMMPGLEKIYLINASRKNPCDGHGPLPTPPWNSSSDAATPISRPPELSRQSPRVPPCSTTPTEALRDSLIDVLCKSHGASLKHLIIPSRLPLNNYSITQLTRSCPNLTQLCFALEEVNPEVFRHVLPFASKLKALRFMAPDGPGKDGAAKRKAFLDFEAREDHEYYLNLELSGAYGNPMGMTDVKYIGFGFKVWDTGSLQQEMRTVQDEEGNEMQQQFFTRKVKPLGWDDVADIEIWKLDTTKLV